MYLIFGIQNLLQQKYVKQPEIDKLADLGFKQEAVIKGIESSGINIRSLNLDVSNENAVYLLSITAPMLVTARSFMAFSRMFYNTFDGFKVCLIALLKQIPAAIIVTGPNDQIQMIPTDIAQILALVDNQWTWDFYLNGTRYQSNIPVELANASQEFKNSLTNIFTTVLPNIIETLLLKKCYKSYDQPLVRGFYIFTSLSNEVLWVNMGEDFWQPLMQQNVVEKMRAAVINNLRNRNIDGLDNITVVNVTLRYPDSNEMRKAIVNPFSIFGSLNEDDFKAIGRLLTSFFQVYKREWGVVNPNVPFLGAIARFCFSIERSPELIASTQSVINDFNELIARKIFSIEKVTSNTFIPSTKNYAAIFIIPMQIVTYKIKWYLKRDFIEFFRFFDSVYFKPEYLRMLSPEGIGILKKLSTFDSKVLDSLTLTVNK